MKSNKTMRYNILVLLVLLASSDVARGQSSSPDSTVSVEPSRPRLRLVRYKEDWSFLAGSAGHFGFFDPLKYVPLGEEAYATFGANARLRFDSYTGADFSVPPGGKAFLLQRYMLHADLHAGPRLRLFTQLKSGLVTGLKKPRPIDKDRLALHQLFVDVIPLKSSSFQLTLRVGRQEIKYGRLVDIREGPNVRLSFDAVRVMAKISKWRAETMLARPVELDPGVFDDGWVVPQTTLWNVQLSRSVNLIPDSNSEQVTLYYLGQHREQAVFAQGAASETRHTIGLKLGPPPIHSVGLSVEGAVQFGNHGAGTIMAWLATVESGYILEGLPLRPRIGLLLKAASGDNNLNDPDLQTFSAPYATHRAIPESILIGGYANAYQVQTSVTIHPYRNLAISFLWDFFWRQSVQDAIYRPGSFPLRLAPNSRACFIGHVPRIRAQFSAGKYVSFELNYEWMLGGAYFEAAANESNAHYMSLQATFKF